MYGSYGVSDDAERTAFRRAEKKYKVYYDDSKSSKKKKQLKQVDLSEVVDFKAILRSFNQSGEVPPGTFALQCDFDRPVFCIENRPGFYFIPDALTVEEQGRWIRESLISFPQPYNRTNHNAIYGPIRDLFMAAKERKILVEEEDSSGEEAHAINFSLCSAAEVERNYNVSLPHNKIPDALCDLAKEMAAPAMSKGKVFQPEAAIVNYFGLGDMLGGHLDDMEADWTKPIVSMSLGCKAIFLLGGKSRDDPPLAMFVRSGDVVLMAGEARECFHGVPRIFTDQENAEIAPLELMFSHEDDVCFLEYIRSSRININIRQVF
ncbi:Alpha-ketoglutarate-dependent dioxygenase alkB [Vitis vinifera]|uniref:Alpha-ketoglutarate-dependent dioxygenase alkB n=1 Tax=Vitis vinifera TaxID=29760 RepID=A0A438IRB7_VITVI|nr:Alpha-ketoglutarate-dependent dioxygenase alkB [Vitis vinifera]